MNSYLKNIHTEITHLKTKQKLPTELIHIVLGNQSADMDSITSSIALAFYYAESKQGFYAPVINAPRAELSLRVDVLYVLETLKIDPEFLLYQEELPYLLTLAKQGNLRITLVDHNQLSPGQENFFDCVERIIDHHKDEHVDYPLIEEKLIGIDGSNSTLIGKIVLSSTAETCTPEIAYLLLAAILLDTGNLKSSHVVTDNDTAIARILIEKAGNLYNTNLYDHLLELRHDVDHLSPDLLVKKDYKLYREGQCFYGIASIPKGVIWEAENRMQWKKALEDSLEKQKIFMLGALSFKRNGNDKIFIVYIPFLHHQEVFLQHLRTLEILDEELMLSEYFPDDGLFFFNLKHPLKRKQLQPLLQMSVIKLIPKCVQMLDFWL
ncbi:MAG: DHH family phosphoesterase [Parachlamydiaceae bacterium]|nr:DHH family phosphoesterase [Parachlamydiaceae bacterium]